MKWCNKYECWCEDVVQILGLTDCYSDCDECEYVDEV